MNKRYLDPLHRLGEFEEIQKDIAKRNGIVEVEGCAESQKLHLVFGLPKDIENRIRLVVTYDEARARELLEDYKIYDTRVGFYPAKDLIFFQADIKGNLLTKERMDAIRLIISEQPCTIITTVDALLEHVAPPEQIKGSMAVLREGSRIVEREFAQRLVELGYEKVSRVEDAGQFAIRGGIIDIFSMTEENPYRIELWGEEIDSIRTFDCESQRSVAKQEEICIFPASELVLSQEEKLRGLLRIEKEAGIVSGKMRENFETEQAHRVESFVKQLREEITEGFPVSLDAYLPYFYEEAYSVLELFDRERTTIFLDEPTRLIDKGQVIENEFKESMLQRAAKGYALAGQADLLYPMESVVAKIERYECCALCTISQKLSMYKPYRKYHVSARLVNSYNNSFDALISDLKKYKKNDFGVVLLSPSRTRAKRLAEDILGEGLNAFYTEDSDRVVKPGEVLVSYGRISKGFEYPLVGFVVISESDIFGQKKKKRKRHKSYDGQNISSFNDLQVGDYVVHENHGLGIYQGIEHIEIDKVTKDYMKISYRGGGNLYILATDLGVIQKYASADAKKPKLNKLGGQEWSRTKARVRGAVEVIAHDLVELYAKRQKDNGFIYGPDTVWQTEFEEMFPYEETEDQAAAIEATKQDMMSPKIMDRLICGDVGYGKTEIAIRAAFKAVQEGKQVAFLVPTTILAQQHYNTFIQRMKDYPVRIDLMCRFRTPSEIKATIAGLKNGMVDIAIGTHRLLSKDVQFKDLGLLVIDEEQRFGVTHKEKIKQMRENVDVLTLTATPIPRTLHMSLVGIRDMSVLEEPPQDRMPIQTFVMEYNDEMVREAIVRELARGGQVYYVYNRVNNIADVTAKLRELVPDAEIDYAHGQMKETELEKLMVDFINGDIDVLVSTTIIETGLDIPNVNTIIVHDSDRMGLSQLYQLRGRVGRSNRTSYAFLMYRRDKLLREEAEKRLSAIREFTDLGSGFKIAMKDLEIRGAGNILGRTQHGHMEEVGYDLYCKMLNEAVRREKGEGVAAEFSTSVDADLDAFIPDTYMTNESMKLDMYKRIASVESNEEAEDIVDEMTDRFGKVPEPVRNLIRISLLRVLAHKVFVEDLSAQEKIIKFTFFKKASLDPGMLPELLMKYEGRLTFRNGERPSLIFNREKDTMDVIDRAREILIDMQMLLG